MRNAGTEDPLFCGGISKFDLILWNGKNQFRGCISRAPDSPCIDRGDVDAADACAPNVDPPVCMDAYTTRTDKVTDTGRVDMGFHYSPDWTGSPVTGVRLWMPETTYQPGDACSCKVFVFNTESEPLTGLPLFVILTIAGEYYFAPSFTDFDSYLNQYPSFAPGRTEITVIPEFPWPAGAGSFSGAVFFAALTDPGMSRIIGNVDRFVFGWTE